MNSTQLFASLLVLLLLFSGAVAANGGEHASESNHTGENHAGATSSEISSTFVMAGIGAVVVIAGFIVWWLGKQGD